MIDAFTITIIIPLITLLGCFANGLLAAHREEKRWQAETIKRGLALYDPQTGRWRWKEIGE